MILYIISGELTNHTFSKIGVTTKSTSERFRGMCTIYDSSIIELSLHDAWIIEQLTLSSLTTSRYPCTELRESIFSGWSECFHFNLFDTLLQEVSRHVEALDDYTT